MKIKMSYDEFDNLIETIDSMEVPEDYEFPSVEEAEEKLINVAGVALCLLAAEKSKDKEYSKALNDLIKENVEFTEETYRDIEIDYKNSTERINAILTKIKAIDFHFPGFCPSKEEIDMIADKDLEKDDTALGFLLWVSMLDNDNSATDVINIAQYTKKLLENIFKTM